MAHTYFVSNISNVRAADHCKGDRELFRATAQNYRDLSTDFLPEEENESLGEGPSCVTHDIVSSFRFSKDVTRPQDAEIEALLHSTESFYRSLFVSLYSQSYSMGDVEGNGYTRTYSSIEVKYSRLTVSFRLGPTYIHIHVPSLSPPLYCRSFPTLRPLTEVTILIIL